MSFNKKTPPHLTVIENMNFDKVDNINVNTKNMSATVETLIIKKQKQKTQIPPIDNPLTPGHRAELKELVESWVNLSGYLKNPVSYGAARSMLNKQAKSMGKAGVSTINHYPDCDFERGKKFIKQKIAILNNTTAVKNNAPEWRKSRISAIQTRCKNLNISEENRRGYMVNRFGLGKDSLTKLTDNELQDIYMRTS